MKLDTCDLSESDLKSLHKIMDHLGLNNKNIAFILGITRQYISFIFTKKYMTTRMYRLFIFLIDFLQKLIDKNPEINFRHLSTEPICDYRKRHKQQLVAIKQAFTNYVSKK